MIHTRLTALEKCELLLDGVGVQPCGVGITVTSVPTGINEPVSVHTGQKIHREQARCGGAPVRGAL